MPRYHLISTNAKLMKSNGRGFLVAGLSLAPHRLSGVADVCPQATPGCRSVCNLWFSGRTVTESVRGAMTRRTQLLYTDRAEFDRLLRLDLAKLSINAERKLLEPLFRANVASDLDWSSLAREYPRVTFYDYTKVKSRLAAIKRGLWPTNYELTYSVNERSHHRTIGAYLRAGYNVAAVYDTAYFPQTGRIDNLPQEWKFDGRYWPVVDGDTHDIRLREFDGSGVVVGLRFKGSRKRMPSAIRKGFVFATS